MSPQNDLQEEVKCIVLLTSKPGMSRNDVMNYYQNNHAPLVRRLLPTIRSYTLNFLRPETAFVPETAKSPDFGMMTEISFENEVAYQAFLDAIANPAIRDLIDKDEENFTDRSQTRMIRVDERLV